MEEQKQLEKISLSENLENLFNESAEYFDTLSSEIRKKGVLTKVGVSIDSIPHIAQLNMALSFLENLQEKDLSTLFRDKDQKNHIFDSIKGFVNVFNLSAVNTNVYSYIDGTLCKDASNIISKVVEYMNKQKVKNNVNNTLLEK